MSIIRYFLILQIAIFLVAVSIHSGALLDGYRQQDAGTAESLIAAVLFVGLLLTWAPALWGRRAALGAQAFGIFGVLVGLATIAAGVGPRTALDLVLHAVMLVSLIAGFLVTRRTTF